MPLARLLLFLLASLPPAAFADEAAEVQKLIRSGDLQAALQRADRAAAADARDARVRFLRGVVLMDLSRDADALAAFERLVEDFPELPEPYNNIALLQARAGRLNEARAALEVALRNDPAQLIARQNLGDIYLRLALRSWEQTAAAAPPDAALQRKLRLARELVIGGR